VSRSVWHVHLVVPEVSDISSSLPGFVYYGVLFIVFHRFFMWLRSSLLYISLGMA